jgi:hypothetical protein
VRGSQWRLLAPPAPTFFLHHVLQQPAPDLLRHVLHQPCGIVSFSVGRQHCFRFRVALSVLWFFFPGNCTAWETTGASSSCCSIQIHVYRTCATVLICFPPAFFCPHNPHHLDLFSSILSSYNIYFHCVHIQIFSFGLLFINQYNHPLFLTRERVQPLWILYTQPFLAFLQEVVSKT